MSTPVIVWGATGQARVLADFLPALGYRIECFIDRDPTVVSPVPGIPVLLGESGFREWMASRNHAPAAIVAIGGARGVDRLDRQEFMRTAGCTLLTVVHPSAVVSERAQLGIGTQVLAGAVVGPDSQLGDGVIVNTRASVDHECRLGDGVHLAPGVILCGLVEVGRLTFIGAGAVVLPRVRIGSGAVIGAGSLVTRDISDNVVAYGHPARIIRPRLIPGS